MHRLHRFAIVLAAMIIALGGFARPSFAQHVMNFSFYTDYALLDDGTVSTIVNGYDNSTGCDHSMYNTYASLSAPSGFYDGNFGLTASFTVPSLEGDYNISSSLTLYCDCVGWLSPGGVSEQMQLGNFRAVFSKKGPNGALWEYGAMCTHSCQPLRVCIGTEANYCFFQGRKAVSPGGTHCKQDTPIFTSTNYTDNPCIGSGSGP